MDIETQLVFIKNERQKHIDAITALDSIKGTIEGTVAAQLSSLAPLVAERDALLTDKAILEQTVVDKQVEIDTLSKQIAVADVAVDVTLKP